MLCAEDLQLKVDRQCLLQGASFSIARGERVVLVGPSGSGKSVLLKLIAGILRPNPRRLQVEGSLRFDGLDLLRRQSPRGRIGILFQNPSLFDEWTPLQNVRFAERRRRKDRPGPDGSELLDRFGIRANAVVRTLSGGQQQRVALARALALAPDLLLYDEPTTGLDPANAIKVAQQIAKTHEGDGAAALIVTHDVATLAPIADRILLLDPASGTIEEVSADEVEERLRHLDPNPAVGPTLPRPGPGTRWLEATADLVSAALLAVFRLVPLVSPRDALRSSLRWARLCASPGAFLYFVVAGAIVGFVTTYFTFEHIPKRGFTEPLFIEDILRALGFLLYRVLCPVILTILIAARSGAAIASEVGNKAYAGQLDAMRSLGASPSRHLFTSLLWTTLWTTPLLFAVMFIAARAVCLGVFILGHPDETSFFWDANFHRSLRDPEQSLWLGTGWLALKVQLCAFGTATIAWFQGVRNKESANQVSEAVTRTIIGASLFVLLVHFVLAFFEF